jgi:hypothetical protein
MDGWYTIDFSLPVLKMGEDDYRPAIITPNNLGDPAGFFNIQPVMEGKVSDADLPESLLVETHRYPVEPFTYFGPLQTFNFTKTNEILQNERITTGGCPNNPSSTAYIDNIHNNRAYYVGQTFNFGEPPNHIIYTQYIVIVGGLHLNKCVNFGDAQEYYRSSFWRLILKIERGFVQSAGFPDEKICSFTALTSSGSSNIGRYLIQRNDIFEAATDVSESHNLNKNSLTISGPIQGEVNKRQTGFLGNYWIGEGLQQATGKTKKLYLHQDDGTGKFVINYNYCKIGSQADPIGSYEGGFIVS